MKRIILGLSVLLMLVQNGFAKSDAEYDKMINSNNYSEMSKQSIRCNKAALNHPHSSDVNICLKVVEMMKAKGYNDRACRIEYLDIGLLYDLSKNDKLKAYEYYMKAARLGNIQAQKNLNIMCKESPWACK